MIIGKYNDYFGRSKSYFGKSYIDYSLKEISNNNQLTPEEKLIIKKAKIKYRLIACFNFCIFLFTAKKIYRKGIIELYSGDWVLKIKDGFLFSLVFSIGAMVLLYRESQRIYYNDVKYVIKKYKYVKSKQYADAVINSKIAEKYRHQLDQIEKGL